MKDIKDRVLTREEVDKRNSPFFVLDGALFRAGFEYINAFTIVSVFIHTITGSVVLAGLSQFMQTFFMQLGRFVTAPKIHTIKNQAMYIAKINILSRIMWLVLSIMLFMNVDTNIIIVMLFVTIAISWFINGSIWPVFEDMLARTILPRRRSVVIGNRELFGGLTAFLGSFVIKQILGSTLTVNIKYGILFSLGFFFLLSAGMSFIKMKDTNYKIDKNPMSLLKVLKSIRKILHDDRNYRWYLIMRCTWLVVDSALLWTLIAVKSVGDLDDITVSYLLIAQIVGRIIGAAIWGRIAQKQGSRNAIIVAHVINIFIAISVIVAISQASIPIAIYMAVCFVVGLSTPAVMVNFVYFSQTTHTRKRPRFMTIESAVSMPLAFVSYLFGIIAKNFGFVPIYVVLIFGSLLILMIALFKLLKPSEMLSIDS